MSTTRRSFLATALATGAAASLTLAGTKASGKVLGANSVVRLGVAGINGRGGAHISEFGGNKECQITYLIDPDTRLHGSRAKSVADRSGVTPKTITNIREALDDKNLDAISVATPNHWHAVIGIWACNAGKHVYVEKPCSHNVKEGRALVEAAQRNGVVVQHGTQGRGDGKWQKLAAEIAAGNKGKLVVSRGTCYKRRTSIGVKPTSAVPAGLDFDLWTGPAPKQDFHANLVHYNWHWFWDFGNGDIGNQGVHQMDVARWLIPNATLPKTVVSVGGRFGYKDQGETPNTLLSIMDFGETMLVFEVRGLPPSGDVGNHQVFDTKATARPIDIKPHAGVKSPIAPRGPGNVFSNFIHCVKSGTPENLDAHVLEAHYSSALCHLANISFRLGKDVPFDTKTGVFADNAYASERFANMQEHLKDNGVTLANEMYRVGRVLQIDAAKEEVMGDPEANALLTRQYRKGYEIA